MQFIDLAAQQKRIKDTIDNNISRIMQSCSFINGPEVGAIEEKLAGYAGVKYAVGCSSGTDALLMPLMAYGLKPGDAVFTTPFTFIATAEVIALLGAIPVFVDIEKNSFNINAAMLYEAIKNVKSAGKLIPKAIIPVDLFGQCADYDEINAIAEKHGLFVLEDAAQSFGAMYKGRRACSLANAAATSFFPAKPFGCYGDGGMTFTDSKELYDKLISIRVHGQGSDKYNNVRIGINGRLDTIQAAILLAKFEIFEEEIMLRQKAAGKYSDGLKKSVTVPFVKQHNLSVWAQYSVMHPERNKIISRLKDNGIPTAVYYPKPLHMQDAFAYLGHRQGDFPVSEAVAQNIFSLPMHPYLDEKDQERIIDIINKFA
jgi:UDP-2-acetamido-2-deoxy-ribo-hexuluronate aminotransferase